jgi:DNA-binding transcriptional LysR family regulator
VNLGQLEHLLALAETGSFSKAAQRVHLTQPALSRSIQALEEELEGRLVDRIGRKNEMTALGTTVIQRARQILSGVVELRQAAKHVKAGQWGSLNIGLGAGPASVLTEPLLLHGALNYPFVRIGIQRGRIDALLKGLRSRELDVLIFDERSIAAEPDVVIERLPDLRVGIFCRPGHPLASRARIEFSDLTRYPVASTAIAPEVARHLVESFGPQARPESFVTLQSDEVGPLIEVAAASDTIFIGLRRAAQQALMAGSLVERQIKPNLISVARFCIVTLEGRQASPLLPLVRAMAEAHLKD